MSTISQTAVLVPLHEEMGYIDEILTQIKSPRFLRTHPEEFDSTKSEFFYRVTFEDRSSQSLRFIVLDRDQRHTMGNISTAASTFSNFLFDVPETIILVGLAGSIDANEARLGDVVVSTSAKMFAPDKLRKIDDKKEVCRSVESLAEDDLSSLSAKGQIFIDCRKSMQGGLFFRFRRDIAECSLSVERQVGYREHLARHPIDDLLPVDHVALKGLAEELVPKYANLKPKVCFGAVFGSEWVVDSGEYVKFIKERDKENRYDYYRQKDLLTKSGELEGQKRNRWDRSKLLAIDMETFGFFKAVEARAKLKGGIQAFSVRGISDLAAEKSELQDATEARVRGVSVRNAARVAIDLIVNLHRWNLKYRR